MTFSSDMTGVIVLVTYGIINTLKFCNMGQKSFKKEQGKPVILLENWD